MVAVAGVSIYLVFAAITEVLASRPRLSTLDPWHRGLWPLMATGLDASRRRERVDYRLASTSECGSVSAAKDHTLAEC